MTSSTAPGSPACGPSTRASWPIAMLGLDQGHPTDRETPPCRHGQRDWIGDLPDDRHHGRAPALGDAHPGGLGSGGRDRVGRRADLRRDGLDVSPVGRALRLSRGSLGPLVGIPVRVAGVTVVLTGSVAAVAVGFAEYFGYFVPSLGTDRQIAAVPLPWGVCRSRPGRSSPPCQSACWVPSTTSACAPATPCRHF